MHHVKSIFFSYRYVQLTSETLYAVDVQYCIQYTMHGILTMIPLLTSKSEVQYLSYKPYPMEHSN